MKDYSTSIEDRKKFILKYELDGQNLVIYLANKEKYIIPYTRENEKEILKRMREQIPNKEEQERWVGVDLSCMILFYFIIACVIVSSIMSGNFASILLSFSVGGILVGETLPGLIKSKQAENDLMKLNLWLENITDLRENAFSSKNLYNGVSKKTAEKISSKKAVYEDPFSINNISEYSLKDIEQMLDNIKRQKEFNFEEEEISEAELHDLAIAHTLSKKIK